MSRFTQRLGLILLGLGLAAGTYLAGCARLQQTDGGALLAQVDPVLRAAVPGSQLGLSLTPREVKTGETVSVQVQTETPGYLYLVQLSTDGRDMTLLFPNGVDGANYLSGGAVQLPRPSWQLKAKGPAGVGYVVAILADQPQDLNQLQASLGRQRLSVEGTYRATLASMLETAP